MYNNYDEMLKDLQKSGEKKRIIVAGANDEHALEAAFESQKQGIVTPILVGPEDEIKLLIDKLGYSNENYKIVNADSHVNPSEVAVKLIHDGHADFIMKGKMETKNLLKPILNKETGLNKSGFITHFGYMQLDSYHKFLAMSDSAVIPYPTFDQKVSIVKACVSALHKLGYDKPIIGALCAVETISDKMPETAEAAKLQEMAEKGEFGSVAIVGPISYDLATSKESAEIKGYNSPYAGDVDMLLVPQMVTGNVMSKIWNVDDKNILSGCLIGADVPIVLTSRSASMKEKLNSILLCARLS